MTFGDMPDLCHRNPKVYEEVINLAQWMVETIGFDGFRFDFVKGYGPWMVKSIAELRYLNKADEGFYPFLRRRVLGRRAHDRRLAQRRSTRSWTTRSSAFDFPLHYRLKGLCDTYGFSLTHSGRSRHGGSGLRLCAR